jgi:hypothetical protein
MGQTLTWSRPLITSLVALAVTALILVGVLFPPLAVAMFTPGVQENQPQHEIARLVKQHDAQVALYRDRFDGRSVFFNPPAIRKPTPPPAPRDDTPIVKSEPSQPSGPPPAPRNYRGPTPTAIIGDEVHFVGDLRLKVGEEGDGVKVVSVDPPWSAELSYSGGTYTVPLFESVGDSLFDQGTTRRTSLPGIQEVPEEASSPETDNAMPGATAAITDETAEKPAEEPRINPDGEKEDDEAREEEPPDSEPQLPEDQPREIPDE